MEEKLQEVFRDLFGLKDISDISNKTRGEISGWDSLKHMELIARLETELEVEFSIEEIVSLNSYNSISELLRKK